MLTISDYTVIDLIKIIAKILDVKLLFESFRDIFLIDLAF